MATEVKTGGRLFTEICTLAANQKGIVNLGQGFPDFSPAPHVLDALISVVKSGDPLLHQYCRSFGHVRLVNAVSRLYSPYYKRELDPLRNILIPVGAYGGLVCSIESNVGKGDEVIVFEPFFDCYHDMIVAAGATPVFIPLEPGKTHETSSWTFDQRYLLSKINSNTKAILLNTPSNPLGKVFNQRELGIIRDVCIEFDLICIADEVYEWLVYEPQKHIKIATLEGMWERTLTIGSGGKTFCATGWKVGWVIGPERLIAKCQTVFQRCYYRCPTPIQEAVARALETEVANLGSKDSYLTGLAKDVQQKRDWLARELTKIGMTPVIPEGGYFILANISNFQKEIPSSGVAQITPGDTNDIRFVKWLIVEKKLGTIPVSLFYSDDKKERDMRFVRICFVKKDSTLQAAVNILRELKQCV